MKLIKIEDLQIGDEILVSSGSKIKYLKVLKQPALSDKKGWVKSVDNEGYFIWDRNGTKYKSLLCSTCIKEVVYKYRGWKGGADTFRTHKEYVFEQDVSKHNKKVNIDLNRRDIYLVKREEIKKEQIF